MLVANASLAYERGDRILAQKHLDQALHLDPSHVQATLLRVRIAAEEGNLPYGRRKLRELLELVPDEADLREAHSGILYLLGQYEEALSELDLADRLREDAEGCWRTNYHRGLIAEAVGGVLDPACRDREDLAGIRPTARDLCQSQVDYPPAVNSRNSVQ